MGSSPEDPGSNGVFLQTIFFTRLSNVIRTMLLTGWIYSFLLDYINMLHACLYRR